MTRLATIAPLLALLACEAQPPDSYTPVPSECYTNEQTGERCCFKEVCTLYEEGCDICNIYQCITTFHDGCTSPGEYAYLRSEDAEATVACYSPLNCTAAQDQICAMCAQ